MSSYFLYDPSLGSFVSFLPATLAIRALGLKRVFYSPGAKIDRRYIPRHSSGLTIELDD